MLLAGQGEEFTQASKLQGLAVTTDHPPPWRISCAGAGLWWSGVIYSYTLGAQALGFPRGFRPRSAPTGVFPGAKIKIKKVLNDLSFHHEKSKLNPAQVKG